MSADVIALVRTELRVEARTRGTLLVLLPYAVAAMALVALATGADLALLRRAAPGLLWSVVVVLGTLTATRQGFATDPTRRDLLHLLGLAPEVVWLGRVVAAALLLLALEAALALAAVVLLNLTISDLLLQAVSGVVTAAGLAALGVLARDLADGANSGVALVPLIVVPLAVPLALAPVQADALAAAGTNGWPWLAVSGLITTVALAAGVAAASTLQEVAG